MMEIKKRSRGKEQTTSKAVESMIEKRKKDNKSGVVTVCKGPNGLSHSFQVFSQVWKYCDLVGLGENTLDHQFSLPTKQVKTSFLPTFSLPFSIFSVFTLTKQGELMCEFQLKHLFLN